MSPINKKPEKHTGPENAKQAAEFPSDEVEKLKNNISLLSGKIAAAFLAEKQKNSRSRGSPGSTFGNILTQLTRFVTLSPQSAAAEQQLAQNRAILGALQTKYCSLLRDPRAPLSARHARVVAEVAAKISAWVGAISREADRRLVENRTLRAIVEEAAAEVDAQACLLDGPRPEARKPILRTQSETAPALASREVSFTATASPGSSPGSTLGSTLGSGTTMSSVDDVYDWANWMVDAMATAEEWRSWIQKTVEETRSMTEELKPASEGEMEAWKANVADEAVKLIKRKKEIQETAPVWAKECCDTMVARDFALNAVSPRSRSSSPSTRTSRSASASRPTLAEQQATIGQPRPSSRQNAPPASRPPSRQNVAPLPKTASLTTPSRLNLSAPIAGKLNAAASRQNAAASPSVSAARPASGQRLPPASPRSTSPPKRADAANCSPVSRLSVRQRDNEKRSVYATEFTRKKNVAVRNTRPVAAARISSISNPAGSYSVDVSKSRRPRSPYSVPPSKCPVHAKEAKMTPTPSIASKSRRTSPPRDLELKMAPAPNNTSKSRRTSPQRESELKMSNAKATSAIPSHFVPPRMAAKAKQEVGVNSTNAAMRKVHK